MNKSKIRSLTWKYFIKQKISEIFLGLFWIGTLGFALILLPYLIGHIGGCIVLLEGQCSDFIDFYIKGLLTIMVLVLMVFLGYALISAIKDWIKSNWKTAQQRAREELR